MLQGISAGRASASTRSHRSAVSSPSQAPCVSRNIERSPSWLSRMSLLCAVHSGWCQAHRSGVPMFRPCLIRRQRQWKSPTHGGVCFWLRAERRPCHSVHQQCFPKTWPDPRSRAAQLDCLDYRTFAPLQDSAGLSIGCHGPNLTARQGVYPYCQQGRLDITSP